MVIRTDIVFWVSCSLPEDCLLQDKRLEHVAKTGGECKSLWTVSLYPRPSSKARTHTHNTHTGTGTHINKHTHTHTHIFTHTQAHTNTHPHTRYITAYANLVRPPPPKHTHTHRSLQCECVCTCNPDCDSSPPLPPPWKDNRQLCYQQGILCTHTNTDTHTNRHTQAHTHTRLCWQSDWVFGSVIRPWHHKKASMRSSFFDHQCAGEWMHLLNVHFPWVVSLLLSLLFFVFLPFSISLSVSYLAPLCA